MANHVLSLEVPTVMNTCILKIMDTSVYSDLLPVTCPTLNVTVPGFAYSVQLEGTQMTEFVASGHITLTACNLNLQTTNCGTQYANLPDGIYVIKYSVSPNDQVFVEYNYLRVTSALNLYYTKLGELDVKACEPDQEIKSKLAEMRLIKSMIDAAKAKVEYCHNPKQGYELFVYALKRLEKVCV